MATSSHDQDEIDNQVGSILYQHTPEIRHMIYSELFYSTRLARGNRRESSTKAKKIRPAPNALAILRTCHRAYNETNTWLRKVLFHFEDPMTMLDKLTPLAPDVLSNLRHLRVSGNLLKPGVPGYGGRHRLAFTLRHLPGLNLDTLTVLDSGFSRTNYRTIEELVSESSG